MVSMELMIEVEGAVTPADATNALNHELDFAPSISRFVTESTEETSHSQSTLPRFDIWFRVL